MICIWLLNNVSFMFVVSLHPINYILIITCASVGISPVNKSQNNPSGSGSAPTIWLLILSRILTYEFQGKPAWAKCITKVLFNAYLLVLLAEAPGIQGWYILEIWYLRRRPIRLFRLRDLSFLSCLHTSTDKNLVLIRCNCQIFEPYE